MMSSILLDDGPLLVHEFFRLARVPPLVVLSACDAGMASAPADGAAFGLAGAFLDRGARTVVAGIVPVRDDEAARLMAEFHRLLAQGQRPGEGAGERGGHHRRAGIRLLRHRSRARGSGGSSTSANTALWSVSGRRWTEKACTAALSSTKTWSSVTGGMGSTP